MESGKRKARDRHMAPESPGGVLRTGEASFRDRIGILVLTGVTLGLLIAGIVLALLSP